MEFKKPPTGEADGRLGSMSSCEIPLVHDDFGSESDA